MNQKNKNWIPLPNVSTRPSPSRFVSRIALIATCLVALQATPTLHAADVTWSSTGTSTFGGDGNWTGGTTWWDGSTGVSWTDGDSAIFRAAGNTTVNSSVIVDRITFSNHTDNISIVNGAGDLTVNSGITAVNPFNVSARTFTISESIALGASQTWEVRNAGTSGAGTANLLVSDSISGSGYGLTKTGNGTLTLSGTNNTYTGDTTISAGTLLLANTAANNTTIRGNILINGGTLAFANVNQIADTSSVTMTSGNMLWSQGDSISSLSISGGTVNLTSSSSVLNSSSFTGGGLTVGARSISATLNGPITIGNFNFGWGGNVATGNGIVIGGDISVNAGTTVNFQGTNSWSGFNGRLTLNADRVIDVGTGANMNVQWGIAGTGNGITKNGTGTLTLSGANSYSGATVVSAGSMIVNGSTAAGSTLTVNSGGTLGGSGTIGGATTISGIHSPGNSPGIQTFSSDLTYAGTPTVQWELTANTTTQGSPTRVFDQIIVGGNLDFSVPTTLTLNFAFTGSTVDWSNSLWDSNITGTDGWLVYDVTGTLSNFGNLQISVANWADGSGDLFDTVRAGSSFSLIQNGNDIYLNYAVPEPSTYALLMLAAAGLGAHVVRRRKR